MGILFNADEILEIAEQIERNGARFYRQMAKEKTATDISRFLLRLAEMEDRHEQVFAEMRAGLSAREKEETVFDPDDEITLYLRAFADEHVFKVSKDFSEYLTGKETAQDILRIAIGFEKDSIVFYSGIMDKVPEKLGKDRVNNIIQEEVGHIAQLHKELMALSPNNSETIPK